MTAKELGEKSLEKLKTFKIRPILPALRKLNEGAMEDVLNVNGSANYQWISGLIEIVKPKQIIELGGAMGVWDIMVLNSPYQDFKLWSITLEEHGLEFSYVVDKYSNFIPVLGDDLDLKNWPKDLDLSKTDIWYFDSLHTAKQLQAELDLYTPFFKKGAVLIFDDIRMDELWPIWEKFIKNKDAIELSDPLHYSGYGLCIV